LAVLALAALLLFRGRHRLRAAMLLGLALVAAITVDIRPTADRAVALGWGGAAPLMHHVLPVPHVTTHSRSVRHRITGRRVQIPAIGVDAPVVSLGLNANRTLQVPQDPANAGWWSGGTAPGRPGPAVIVGHVDWAGHSAVFARLHDLVPGARVVVRGFGAPRTYVVTAQQSYPKSAFPTGLVYDPTPDPVLRLITCTGRFDPATGHYADNLIVFAKLDRA
jgi:sortase (surface protein transpeptidase)